MKRYVYVNDRLVPEEKATVSVFDRGLNYGHGVFETMKAIDGKAVYLKEHLDRLEKGAKAIGIKSHCLQNLYNGIKGNMLQRLLNANGLATGQSYIRITITTGKDYGGHLPSKGLKPAIIAIAKAIDVKGISLLQKNGVRAITISGISPALGQIKSLNYLPNVLAKMEAERKGVYEGIFITANGLVLEGSSTNVFIVSKGVLKTPLTSILSPRGRGGKIQFMPFPYNLLSPQGRGGKIQFMPFPHNLLSPQGRGKGEGVVSYGILPGIMRQAVIETARENGIKVIERGITVKELMKADEVFLTNSIIEVVPLIKIDSKPIWEGRPGHVTRLLQREMAGRTVR